MSMYTKTRQHVRTAAALLASSVLMTACGSVTYRGELGKDRQILATCDKSAPPASLVEIDGTGSSASDQITAERMAAVASIVRQTAICSGDLRVLVFSSSSAGTVTLADGPLHLDGATVNARLKRVPRLVDSVMAQIKKAYGPAAAELNQDGSDIVAQYRLAGEWISQIGGDARLHLYLLTDGFQTVGFHLGSKSVAQGAAMRVAMPKLPGAFVTVAGLGRVAGTPPQSDVVEGLVTYYTTLCQKTGAAKCLAVTDYTAAGQ